MELLIVGLDGLSENMLDEFDVATPMLDDVQEKGVSGELMSVDTPTTLPAWTSFATGKDPGSHGVSTMLRQDASYEITPARPNETDAALYDYLDETVVINLPGSVTRRPARPDNVLVSSFLADDPDDAVPEELQEMDAFDAYEIQDDASLKSNPEAYVDHLREVTEARFHFATETFDRHDPRIGFVLFSTPDWVGHFLAQAPDDEKRGEWYRRIVEAVDEYAGELAAQAENIVLLSDHGFEPKEQAIYLQTWLHDEGYLVEGSNETSTQRVGRRVAQLLGKHASPLFELAHTFYQRLQHAAGEDVLDSLVSLNPDVDFERSTAWHLRYGCLYLNDDRFEHPTVDDPSALQRELREQLAGLTDEGNQVFQDVLTPEEAYADPSPDAPDLIVRPASDYLPLRAWSPRQEWVTDRPGHGHYDHRYRGVFAAAGPAFVDQCDDVDLSIVDVLPTLFHALGEPIAPDFDGEVYDSILTRDDEPTVLDRAALPTPRVREREADAERDERVEARLRELGYME